MDGDKTLNEAKEELARQGYAQNGANSFVNKYGQQVETDGNWAREDSSSTWKKVGDEDNPLHKK